MLASYKKNKSMAVTGFGVQNPKEYGVFDVKKGIMKRVVEKSKSPPSNLANAGLYLFTPEVFDYIDKTPESVRGAS